jgi:hypothetical protein
VLARGLALSSLPCVARVYLLMGGFGSFSAAYARWAERGDVASTSSTLDLSSLVGSAAEQAVAIIPGRLWLGNKRNASDLHVIRELGITCVLNCTAEVPNYHPNHISYHRVPLLDEVDQSLMELIPPAFKFMG